MPDRLYTDDVGTVYKSTEGLAKMTADIVAVYKH